MTVGEVMTEVRKDSPFYFMTGGRDDHLRRGAAGPALLRPGTSSQLHG
jgi:hypothetical protein